MCFKKLFNKPNPIPVPTGPTKRRLLSFAINNYPGSQNDLNGCLNDQDNLSNKVLNLFPDFDVKKFRDSQVTVDCYKTEVAKAISTLSPGATVLVLPDSCFSGTITRFMEMGIVEEKHPTTNRYFQNPEMSKRTEVSAKVFKTGLIRWIVISGCKENQTSSDAFIEGKYEGAFTWYAVRALKAGMTYKEWFTELRKFLPSLYYDQEPTLEGPEELLNGKIFEDETLILHNSSHGTQVPCNKPDEPDGYDEALYLYDGPLIDDEIGKLLDRIPY